jgi:hypothetical protein
MSAERKILQTIIDKAIPADIGLPSLPSTDATPNDLLRKRAELEGKIKKIAEFKPKPPKLPTRTSGPIKKLIPPIPVKILPSLADLQDALDQRFDTLKKNAQKATTKTQFNNAEEAKRPFSRLKNISGNRN